MTSRRVLPVRFGDSSPHAGRGFGFSGSASATMAGLSLDGVFSFWVVAACVGIVCATSCDGLASVEASVLSDFLRLRLDASAGLIASPLFVFSASLLFIFARALGGAGGSRAETAARPAGALWAGLIGTQVVLAPSEWCT